MMNMPTTRFLQQGASLVVTLILVVMLSLLALYGAGVLVLDTRSAANDYRAREAMAAAEVGLEQGYSLLSANRGAFRALGLDLNGDGDVADANEVGWNNTCTSSSTSDPCVAIASADRGNWKYLTINSALTTAPDLGSYSVWLMTPKTGDDSRLVYTIVAKGLSEDGSSNALVKQGAFFYPLVVSAVDSPMMSYGDIGGTGTFDVVANPNGGGSGVPVTAWSKNNLTLGGSGKTCNLGEFLSSKPTSFHTIVTDSNGNSLTKCPSCSCPSSGALSSAGSNGPDVVAPDDSFPDDVFKFLFGVDYEDYDQVKSNAIQASGCGGLNTSSSGLIWVTGACSISTSVGSFDAPVLIVVQDGAVSITCGGEIFGMLFVFSSSGYSATATNVHLAGGTTFYGAIMTNTKIDLGNGTYKMRFDKNALENIQRNPSGRALSRVPGSWTDVRVE